ncbi:MAG: hypothetical protein QW392_03165 [Candidatus Jordarchaeales archaeon]
MESKRKIVGVNVKNVETFPNRLPVGGLIPTSMQAKTRRDVTILEGGAVEGNMRRYDSTPGTITGTGLWSDRGRRREAAAASGRYPFTEENPFVE